MEVLTPDSIDAVDVFLLEEKMVSFVLFNWLD